MKRRSTASRRRCCSSARSASARPLRSTNRRRPGVRARARDREDDHAGVAGRPGDSIGAFRVDRAACIEGVGVVATHLAVQTQRAPEDRRVRIEVLEILVDPHRRERVYPASSFVLLASVTEVGQCGRSCPRRWDSSPSRSFRHRRMGRARNSVSHRFLLSGWSSSPR